MSTFKPQNQIITLPIQIQSMAHDYEISKYDILAFLCDLRSPLAINDKRADLLILNANIIRHVADSDGYSSEKQAYIVIQFRGKWSNLTRKEYREVKQNLQENIENEIKLYLLN